MVKIPFFKNGFLAQKPGGELAAQSPENGQAQEKDAEIARQEIELLKIVLLRYREHIESNESKNIIEMKGMIKPHDPVIIAQRDAILEGFHPYIYAEHFLEAAKLACARAEKIKTVSLPLNFWLSYDDMVSIGAADDIGKAMFLCSLLRSLDSQDAKVAICADRKPLVAFTFDSKLYACTPDSGIGEAQAEGDFESIGGQKVSYAFNDLEYTDKSEGE
ncbi:MAG TPA: hypothetical protein PLO51_05890 [Candidatus Micrarchaeota archaeon]|nr:hypothetical protein [Candidatus Micrarchaeota archaeon]